MFVTPVPLPPLASSKRWPRRLRVLAAAALMLAVAVPLVAAFEGWQIDATGVLNSGSPT